MDLEWKDTSELPMNEQMYKKILLLAKGRYNEEPLNYHIVTDYWDVFLSEKELDPSVYNKKKDTSNGMILYGRLGERKVPFNKIKAWMFADELISLYDGK